LDAALARGADPCGSLALAYRSARLTSERGRERLAASLDRVLDAAVRPARRPSAAVPPCRDEVVAAGPLLIEARELLRSRTPVYSRGAARLENLLRDGGRGIFIIRALMQDVRAIRTGHGMRIEFLCARS